MKTLTEKEVKTFLRYVYRLEEIADGECYNKPYTDKVAAIFEKLRGD